MVALGNNTEDLPIAAKAATSVQPGDIGRQAAVLFENGDARSPVVMGLIQNLAKTPEQSPAPNAMEQQVAANSFGGVVVDGEKVLLNAEKEIILQCGKASITLTRAGKIIVRGAYVSSKSSGVNRIHGGSVQIN